MIKRRPFFILPILLAGFFLFPLISRSAPGGEVVISEVAWMGTEASANNEWLELYNNTDADIDLSNWTLASSDGTPSIILNGVIKAHDYFLLERTSDESLPDLAADQVYTGALGNSGEILELRDNNNNLIEAIDCSSGWFFGDNDEKTTMERIDSFLPGTISNWASSQLPGGTPKAVNSVRAILNLSPVALAGDDVSADVGEEVLFDGSLSLDSDGSITYYEWDFGDGATSSGVLVSHIYNLTGSYSVVLTITDNLGATSSDSLVANINPLATTTSQIKVGDLAINEFVSDQEAGQKEWIELYNNTTSTIDLSGLVLEDGLNVIASLSGEITASGFKIFELSSSKLNNNGDKIILKYQDDIIDQVSYGDWDDGTLSDNALSTGNPNSVARKINGQDSDIDSSDFAITITPTKNGSNLITPLPTVVPPTAPSGAPSSGGAVQTINVFFQKSDVVINELVSDPSDGEVEWIELYNNTAKAIDLGNWLIEDGSGKKTTLSGLIGAHQFKIMENPKGSLNNGGDLVILKDPNNNIIDQVSYGDWDDGDVFDNAPKTTDPYALARLIDGQDTDIDYNDFRITSSPTKGSPNVINGLENKKTKEKETEIKEEVVANYLSLIITEIFPNPEGSDMASEFIEIYNPNDQAVNLTDWLLDDQDGGSRPHRLIDLTIEPHEYLSFARKDTGLALNNDTDKARLINPSGEVASEAEYKNIKEGMSYIFYNNKWDTTSLPTPGEENEMEISSPAIKTASSANKTIKITGTVLVEPGILGSQIFYIQDENIQVYSYKKDFPLLAVGDIIEVRGELSESAGEKRIKIKTKNDIKIIGRQNELWPSAVSIAEIDESSLGQLVKIAGEVIEIKGNNVFVDDGTGEIKVYLKTSAQIDKALFKAGEKIELVGIVSLSSNDYRILPRYDTDILVLGEVKGESAQGGQEKDIKNSNKYFIAVIVFMSLIIAWLFYKQYTQRQNSGN